MAKRCLSSLKIGSIVYPLSSIDDFSFLSDSAYSETRVPTNTRSYIDIPSTFHLAEEPTFKILSDLNRKNYSVGHGGSFDYPRESGTDGNGFFTGWLFYYQNDALCGDRFYTEISSRAKSTYLVIVVDDDTKDAWMVHIGKDANGQIAYYHLHPKNGNENILYTIFGSKDSGGAGSGYIGNSLLSNKKMVGYNVPTSEAESTKTESVNEASASPVSGKPKIGNGHAKIRFIRDLIETNLSSLAKNTDFVNHRKVSQYATDNISFQYTFADLTSYYLSDWILSGSPNTNTYQNGEFNIPMADTYGSGFLSNGVAIPINGDTKIYGVKFDCKVVYNISGSLPRQGFLELIKIGSGNTVTRIDLLRICRDPSTSYDPDNPSHRLAEDDLYHTYEFIFDSPVTFDYVHVNGSDVDVYIKNIKLLT